MNDSFVVVLSSRVELEVDPVSGAIVVPFVLDPFVVCPDTLDEVEPSGVAFGSKVVPPDVELEVAVISIVVLLLVASVVRSIALDVEDEVRHCLTPLTST